MPLFVDDFEIRRETSQVLFVIVIPKGFLRFHRVKGSTFPTAAFPLDNIFQLHLSFCPPKVFHFHNVEFVPYFRSVVLKNKIKFISRCCSRYYCMATTYGRDVCSLFPRRCTFAIRWGKIRWGISRQDVSTSPSKFSQLRVLKIIELR